MMQILSVINKIQIRLFQINKYNVSYEHVARTEKNSDTKQIIISF